MRILVTGSDGYIGSVLVARLTKVGHDVTGLDTGFYREAWFYHPSSKIIPKTLNIDTRHVTTGCLTGFDAVVHLAELSNDPLGELSPDITRQINYNGSVHLAETAAKAGVKRFVYASSCSVYGLSDEGIVTEESPLNPQTAYARCKVMVEEALRSMASPVFTPVILRNATVFGMSPKQRFDLVVNNLCGLAHTTKQITTTSDGTPWRPLVHVEDVVTAIVMALTAPPETVHGETFNVGGVNFQVREIAECVQQVFGGTVTIGNTMSDKRSYKGSFQKIHDKLGFTCMWRLKDTVIGFNKIFDKMQLDSARFNYRGFTRLKQIEYLLQTGQVNNSLLWI